MNHCLLHICFFLTVFVSACSIDESEKDLIVTVQSEFRVGIYDRLGANPSTVFSIETLEELECKNYLVEAEASGSDNDISISINELTRPDNCEEGMAHAKVDLEAGKLLEGNYQLTISLTDAIKNIGELTVMKDRYLVAMESDDGVRFGEDVYFKIPERTIWGFVAYDDANQYGETVQALLDGLSEMNRTASLRNGHYGYFVRKNGAITWMKDQPERNEVEYFVFQNEEDINGVIELVEAFKTENAVENLAVSLFLWDGREF